MALPFGPDPFTGADGTPIATGGNYANIVNSIEIVGNQASGFLGADFNICKYVGDVMPNDQFASIVPIGTTRAGVGLRMTGTNLATLNGYIILLDNDDNLYTWAVVNGDFNTPGVIDVRTPALFNGTSNAIKAAAIGTSIFYWKDATLIGSPVVDTHFASGQTGPVIYSQNLADNFITDAAGVAGFPPELFVGSRREGMLYV